MSSALAGTRVVDFSHVMAGPYASHLLRLLGADVIKIESPGVGDAMRNYGADRRYDGMSPAFIAVNAGKQSLTLNLKHPPALAAVRRLIGNADVVLENFRPGVMARLGLDYDSARALQPRLVYCSVSGYGQCSPRRDWPAIDNIVQATSGMMSLSGENGDGPMRVGFPVVDTLTGQTAAFAIVAALLRRERTGCGEYIDVAMFDATIAFMASAVVPYLVTGKTLERTGNVGYSGQPTSAVFDAGDERQISLGVVQQAQFESLARTLKCERWLSDGRFATPDLRRQNSRVMREELATVFATQPAEVWERQLSAAGVPCGMVRDVSEAMSLEGLENRGIRIPMHVPGLPDRQEVDIVNAGFKFSQDSPHIDQPPPRLGEHGEAILESLGYDANERREILAGNIR
ncbi:MAG TPA: CaiB/BaiF CoA-transferase family protein [Steroidobacteraceae bacterium]|nr:CaiB/BaiF CoA-transferase family protein [Steroidobacteraceae bacterium]